MMMMMSIRLFLRSLVPSFMSLFFNASRDDDDDDDDDVQKRKCTFGVERNEENVLRFFICFPGNSRR